MLLSLSRSHTLFVCLKSRYSVTIRKHELLLFLPSLLYMSNRQVSPHIIPPLSQSSCASYRSSRIYFRTFTFLVEGLHSCCSDLKLQFPHVHFAMIVSDSYPTSQLFFHSCISLLLFSSYFIVLCSTESIFSCVYHCLQSDQYSISPPNKRVSDCLCICVWRI